MLDVTCPSCGETYHVAEGHVGRSLRCRRCDRVFEIAAPRAGTPPPPPATSQASQASPGFQASQASQGSRGAAAPARPIEVTDRDFAQTVLRSPQPVLVDFWAPWCAPCRAIAPSLEQLAAEYGGRVTFAKLNTDANPRSMAQYGVMGLPTLLLFKDGQEVGRLVGLQPKAAIKQAVDRVA